jgi:hypothetical protein
MHSRPAGREITGAVCKKAQQTLSRKPAIIPNAIKKNHENNKKQ